jgi:hypothetical protein
MPDALLRICPACHGGDYEAWPISGRVGYKMCDTLSPRLISRNSMAFIKTECEHRQQTRRLPAKPNALRVSVKVSRNLAMPWSNAAMTTFGSAPSVASAAFSTRSFAQQAARRDGDAAPPARCQVAKAVRSKRVSRARLRSRPCGDRKSSSGPTGTILVGLIVSWL